MATVDDPLEASLNRLADAADRLAAVTVSHFDPFAELVDLAIRPSEQVEPERESARQSESSSPASTSRILRDVISRQNPDLDAVFGEPATAPPRPVENIRGENPDLDAAMGREPEKSPRKSPVSKQDLFDAILRQHEKKASNTGGGGKAGAGEAAEGEAAAGEAGMAEGAIAGAEEGAVLGPEGAIAGAVIGAAEAGGGKGGGKGGGFLGKIAGLFGAGGGGSGGAGGDGTGGSVSPGGGNAPPGPQGGGGPTLGNGFWGDREEWKNVGRRAAPNTAAGVEAGADIFNAKSLPDAILKVDDFRKAIELSTDRLIEVNRQYAEFSAAMGQVEAMRESREINRNIQVGGELSGSARYLANAEQDRKDATRQIGVFFSKLDNVGTALLNKVETLALAVVPIAAIIEPLNKLIDRVLGKEDDSLTADQWAQRQEEAGRIVQKEAEERMSRVRRMGG